MHNLFSSKGNTQLLIDDIKYPVCIETIRESWDTFPTFEGHFLDVGMLSERKSITNPAFEIKNVIFNDPATVVLWEDGTKSVVKCQDGDIYNKETGLALCIAKKALGNQSNFNNVFKKWVPEEKNLHDSVTFTIDNITLNDPYSDKFDLDNVIEKCNEKFRKLFGGENV